MKGYPSFRKPSDGERHIFVGDKNHVKVEVLLLGIGFYFDLKDTFIVLSFK